jgi:hypothetical protein
LISIGGDVIGNSLAIWVIFARGVVVIIADDKQFVNSGKNKISRSRDFFIASPDNLESDQPHPASAHSFGAKKPSSSAYFSNAWSSSIDFQLAGKWCLFDVDFLA